MKVLRPYELNRLKGTTVLVESERLKTSVGAGGKYSLSITNVLASDDGKYTVRASNDHGESRFTATLLVVGGINMAFA